MNKEQQIKRLGIPQSIYKEVYKNNRTAIKNMNFVYSVPTSHDEFFNKHIFSKLWRLNNLYTCIPKEGGRPQAFKMNLAQHKTYNQALTHKRLIILKSRQQGISTFWQISFLDDIIFNEGHICGLICQKTETSKQLISKLKIIFNELSDDLKKELNIEIDKDNMTELALSNNSKIIASTSFRGGTLQGLHISEYGTIADKSAKNAEEIMTGAGQAIKNGHFIIESTAEGDNLYKQLWDNSVQHYKSDETLTTDQFKPMFLSWVDDPTCKEKQKQTEEEKHTRYFEDLENKLNMTLSNEQKNFWIMKYISLNFQVHKEYPGTPDEAFLQDKEGSFYGKLFNQYIVGHNRIQDGYFNSKYPVQVSLDIGIKDYTVACFFQYINDNIYIINEYTNREQVAQHYLQQIQLMADIHGYKIYNIILPHDSKKKSNVTKVTVESLYRSAKISNKVTTLPKTTSIINQINEVRQSIPNMYMDTKCEYLKQCFINYSKKHNSKTNTFEDKHIDNEYTHGADAIRYMVCGMDKQLGSLMEIKEFQQDEYYKRLNRQQNNRPTNRKLSASMQNYNNNQSLGTFKKKKYNNNRIIDF